MNNVKLTQKELTGNGKQGEADNGGGEVSNVVLCMNCPVRLASEEG